MNAAVLHFCYVDFVCEWLCVCCVCLTMRLNGCVVVDARVKLFLSKMTLDVCTSRYGNVFILL